MRFFLLLLLSAAPASASEFKTWYGKARSSSGAEEIKCLSRAISAWTPEDGLKLFASANAVLGDRLVSGGRFKEALAFYDKAVKSEPTNANYLSNRGLTLQRLNRIETSLRDHQQARRIEPDNALNLVNLCSVYMALERYADANPICRRAAALAPSLSNARLNLATLHAEQGRHKDAAREFAAARATPESPMLESERHTQLQLLKAAEAYLSSLAGRAEESEAIFETLLRDDPKSHLFVFSRGQARVRRGLFGKAVGDFTRALALRPDFAPAYVWRAKAHEKAGRNGKAAEDRGKACRLGWTPVCSDDAEEEEE